MLYAKNWVRRTWTEKVNLREKSTVWSKSTVKPPKSKDDVSGWVKQVTLATTQRRLMWMTLAMTSVRGLRRMEARESAWKRVRGAWPEVAVRERKPRCVVVRGRRVGRMISETEPLNSAWGRMQFSMASRLPRVCRSAQDDLSGTFTNIIRAMFAAVMQRAVVCAVWNSLTTAAASPKPKDDGWMMSEV